jgi:hypothetical protein
MKRQNKCKKLISSIILCAVMAIILSVGSPVWALTIEIGEEYTIPGDYEPGPYETIWVNGTLNILPSAQIYLLYAIDTSTVNITGGDVTLWIDVAEGAAVTVYGTGFNLGEGTHYIDYGNVTGFYENGDEINLTFDCQPGATVTLSAPSIDPVQMLIDLGLYIMDQVDQYQEPIPPDNELIGIAPELEVSLLTKVDAALAALEKGNPNDAKVAMNDLKALVNQVEAQTDKKISQDSATGIISRANEIIEELSTL